MNRMSEKKSFIIECNRIKKLNDTFEIDGILFQSLWLQGFVKEASKDRDFILIDDTTGLAKLVNCSQMPNIWNLLQVGSYVMCIGNFLRLNEFGIAILKTIKLQILNDNPFVHEICWPLEVKIANKF
jgi:hypothetical protein